MQQDLKDFLTNFLNNAFESDRIPDTYVFGRQAFNPRASNRVHRAPLCESGWYEVQVRAWINADEELVQGLENRVMLVVGMLGSGKSSSIRHCLADQRTKARSIIADLKSLDQHIESSDTHESARDRVYWRLISFLSPLSDQISFEERATHFWKYCINRIPEVSCDELHQFLISIHDRASLIYQLLPPSKQVEQIIQEGPISLENDKGLSRPSLIRPETASLQQSRVGEFNHRDLVASDRTEKEVLSSWEWLRGRYDQFEASMRPETRFVLCLLEIGYRASNSDRPLCILLDNADGLPRELQPSIVPIARKISAITGAKTIVTLRPMTYTNLKLESTCQEQVHFAPRVVDVLHRRLSDALASQRFPEDLRRNLYWLVAELDPRKRRTILRDLIEATSGVCVRLGLIHMCNMAQSEIVRSRHLDECTDYQIAQAFFFGSGPTMRTDRFENLFSVRNRKAGFELVKPRILDFIVRIQQGSADEEDVYDFMARFGHSKKVVRDALDELTFAHRELLLRHPRNSSSDSYIELIPTPLGNSYIEYLMSSLRYNQACIAESHTEDVNPNRVIDFHKKLAVRDFEEMTTAFGSVPTQKLSLYYSYETILARTHWAGLSSTLQFLDSSFDYLKTDISRDARMKSDFDYLILNGLDPCSRDADYASGPQT